MSESLLEAAMAKAEAGALAEAERLLASAESTAEKRLHAQLALLQGKLDSGLAALDALEGQDGPLPPLQGNYLRLVGTNDLEETLLLCRLVIVLRRQLPNTRLIVALPGALQPLAARSLTRLQGVQITTLADAVPQGVASLTLRQAARALRLSYPNLPAGQAYLSPEKRDRIAYKDEYSLGFCWRSQDPMTGRKRGVPLKLLANALQHPGVRLVSLQNEESEGELQNVNRSTGVAAQAPMAKEPVSIDRLANFVAGCDLVVTVDGLVAHLAGALGRPCWVLLDRLPSWYWFWERDDSPWYPNHLLYRQETPGEWRDPLGALWFALRALLDERQ